MAHGIIDEEIAERACEEKENRQLVIMQHSPPARSRYGMGRYPHLPQELLSHICSYFVLDPCSYFEIDPVWFDKWEEEHKLGRSTMLNISLASSSLNAAVKPYLYGIIVSPNTSLLRALLIPSNAYVVQNLLGMVWTTQETEGYTPAEPDSELLPYSEVSTVMSNKGLSEQLKIDIHRGLGEGLEDASYALLLLLCPNIRLWHIGALWGSFEDTLVARTVQEVNTLGSALQQVQQVGIVRGDTEEVFDLAKTQMILSLPNVRKVSGYGVGMLAGSEWRMPRCPDMREFVLEVAEVDIHAFSALLSAYENLETLVVVSPDPEDRVYQLYDNAAMGDALRQFGTKLSCLKILREDSSKNRTALGSLADLTSLRKLTLTHEALYGSESTTNQRHATYLQQVLPFSLERLEIFRAAQDEPKILDAQVKALVSDKRFTALKTVQVARVDYGSPSPEDLPDGWNLEDHWTYSCCKPGQRVYYILTKDG